MILSNVVSLIFWGLFVIVVSIAIGGPFLILSAMAGMAIYIGVPVLMLVALFNGLTQSKESKNVTKTK